MGDGDKTINKKEYDEIQDKKDLVSTYLVISTFLITIKQLFINSVGTNITQNTTINATSAHTQFTQFNQDPIFLVAYWFVIFIFLYRASLPKKLDSSAYFLTNLFAIATAIGFCGIVYYSLGVVLHEYPNSEISSLGPVNIDYLSLVLL